MDPLSCLLDADDDRTSEAWSDRTWVLSADALPALRVLTVLEEEAWITPRDGAPVRVAAGEVAVLRPETEYVIAHAATPAPDAVVLSAGPVRLGRTGSGGSHLFLRQYPLDETTTHTFLVGLPLEAPLARLSDGQVWPLLQAECLHLSPARGSVVSRLLDLLLVEAVRRWSARSDAQGWLRAGLDPVVGVALRLVHDDPAHPWTLADLAERVGTSRSTLSRRFHLLVGEPPMRYLQQWRLDRAARLLTETGDSVRSVARDTGFADPFAFSSAFSRRFGVSPARYRSTGPATAGSA